MIELLERQKRLTKNQWKPNLAMLGPAFLYFASWSVVGLIGFWVFGPEPKGLTFDEIDHALDGPPATVRPAVQTAGN